MRNIAVSKGGKSRAITLTFRFKGISQLLDEEDPAPLPQKELTEVADDTFLGYLHELTVRRVVRLVIEMPERDIPVEGGDAISQAIHSHFSFRLRDNAHEIIISWREGMYSLFVSLINFSFAVFVFWYSDAKGIDIEAFPTLLFVGFITILNWVTVWDTYEHFAYDYLRLYRKRGIYTKLSRIPIVVKGY